MRGARSIVQLIQKKRSLLQAEEKSSRETKRVLECFLSSFFGPTVLFDDIIRDIAVSPPRLRIVTTSKTIASELFLQKETLLRGFRKAGIEITDIRIS